MTAADNRPTTVGELKQVISELPDSMPVEGVAVDGESVRISVIVCSYDDVDDPRPPTTCLVYLDD